MSSQGLHHLGRLNDHKAQSIFLSVCLANGGHGELWSMGKRFIKSGWTGPDFNVIYAQRGTIREVNTSKHTQLLWDCCWLAELRGGGNGLVWCRGNAALPGPDRLDLVQFSLGQRWGGGVFCHDTDIFWHNIHSVNNVFNSIYAESCLI